MTAQERFEEALVDLCDGILNPGCEDRHMVFKARVEAVRSTHAACVEEARRDGLREGMERLESSLKEVMKWAMTEDREIFLRRLRSLLDSEQVIRARSKGAEENR